MDRKTKIWILILALVCAAGLSAFLLQRNADREAVIAVITVDGEEIQRVDLSRIKAAYDIPVVTEYGSNTVHVEPGAISVTQADCPDHICASPQAQRGYRFSDAMKNPGFIGLRDIREKYMPMGFSHFKIEGRGLGSAIVLEFLLYYMTKPEYQLKVREEIYLDSMLDLF